jgi:hypothetical protein
MGEFKALGWFVVICAIVTISFWSLQRAGVVPITGDNMHTVIGAP